MCYRMDDKDREHRNAWNELMGSVFPAATDVRIVIGEGFSVMPHAADGEWVYEPWGRPDMGCYTLSQRKFYINWGE